jgi:RNA polymerase sigma factor (TIGR02999 family)
MQAELHQRSRHSLEIFFVTLVPVSQRLPRLGTLSRRNNGIPMSEITRILEAAKNGDREAAEKLLPLTYQELRRIAGHMMAGERDGHTLQPTALIHEAYLRLVGPAGEQPDWDCRAHFFTAAAEAMRWILIDHARRKMALKRGGDRERIGGDGPEQDGAVLQSAHPPEELIAVDEALEKLEIENPQAARVVKLRYFAGMTVPEVAKALGIAPRTVDRTWQGARAWLFRELSD